MVQKNIALIMARGGSKSIPFKNIVKVHGYPLIAWSIAACRLSKKIDEVIVSTDNKKIAKIAEKYGDQIEIMMDSGVRSGPDVARAMASGAKFTFMGRSFMYGVSALGKRGGDHTISLLKTELQQIMEQLCCEKTSDFPNHLIK